MPESFHMPESVQMSDSGRHVTVAPRATAAARAAVIQHVAFEDLGTLEPALQAAGFAIDTLQAGIADLETLRREPPRLLVVLGGPIGVYDHGKYSFLREEIDLLGARLKLGLPTLGICLGAQLMAAALGARVFPGEQGREIGWSPIYPAGEVQRNGLLAPLFEPGVKVLHWHGDTFDLPAGATLLAGSARYTHQAFAVRDHGLALQFHPEVRLPQLERWYIGHACELSQAGLSVPALREQGLRNSALLQPAAQALWQRWLQRLGSA